MFSGRAVSPTAALFFFQAEDGIRVLVRPRGLGDVYKRQALAGARSVLPADPDGTTCAPSLFSSDAGRAAHIERAVRLAREQGRPGDNTVVVLGKGHETGHCLLYTSDAADERSRVDFGGRRIIKKKK